MVRAYFSNLAFALLIYKTVCMQGFEIERKFLINKDKWQIIDKPLKEFYRQGYLHADALKTIRVRQAGSKGFITIKGKTSGIARMEYEYEIPFEEAGLLLDTLAVSSLTKYRYKIHFGDHLWEVDEFLEDNQGLMIAEIELKSETEEFALPEWVGKEVTGDKKYYNASLSRNPFLNW
jgi:CYTH domain-containing protein